MGTKKKDKVIYWAFTGLFLAAVFAGGVTQLTTGPVVAALAAHLGYPLYLFKILGVAKLLGVAAVLTGFFPKIKEWAYAGFTFDLLGAALSHIAIGDAKEATGPLVLLAFMIVSYVFWKKSAGGNHGQRLS